METKTKRARCQWETLYGQVRDKMNAERVALDAMRDTLRLFEVALTLIRDAEPTERVPEYMQGIARAALAKAAVQS
jgi:hypothetical protein